MIYFKKFSKSIFKRTNALIAFTIYSLLIAVLSYSLAKTPEQATPLQQISVPFILGLFGYGISFINKYIDERVREDISLNKTDKLESEKNNIIDKQRFDFVSIIQDKIQINNIVIQKLLDKSDTPKDLEKKLKNNFQNLQISHKTLNSLIFNYKEDKTGKNIEILKIIVAIAVNDKLLDKNHPNFNQKCKYIYAYLRAWLICSIKYETDKLPIEWIKQTAVKKEELIKVILYIKKLLINDEKVKESIQNDDCRELIAEYLDILSKKIEQYQ